MIQKRYEDNMKVGVSSSVVSAGMDIWLGFIKDCFSEQFAIDIANHIEYIWNSDCNKDLFAR